MDGHECFVIKIWNHICYVIANQGHIGNISCHKTNCSILNLEREIENKQCHEPLSYIMLAVSYQMHRLSCIGYIIINNLIIWTVCLAHCILCKSTLRQFINIIISKISLQKYTTNIYVDNLLDMWCILLERDEIRECLSLSWSCQEFLALMDGKRKAHSEGYFSETCLDMF